ncbi:MAG: chemotaxis protein CheD, partial [Spirochaetales bacterium]|nr:chemotaxis protein CheD [Spirochaetales bacterium]
LKTEGIPVIGSDIGGIQARKIFLAPVTGKVLLKRIAISSISEITSEEMDYYNQIKLKYEK